jgi:Uma2 family endonuclease
MVLPLRDTEHHTYADYRTWSDERRYELIYGIAYIKEPPAPTWRHQRLVVELCYQVRGALEGTSCEVCVAPLDVRLPKANEADDEIDTVVQPDVLIICDRHRPDDRGLRGAPDWVAEVLSPSTAKHDRTIKRAAYERAGVRELWLIHPTDLTLTIYRLEAGHYGRATTVKLKGRTPITAVAGVSIDWDRILANLG